jgi:WD40 repeat protein
VTGLVIAVGLASFAVIQRNDAVYQKGVAQLQERTALARALSAQARDGFAADPSLAGVLSLEAYRLRPSAEAHDTTVSVLTRLGSALGPLAGHAGDVVRVIFSPDGKTLVSAGSDDTVRFWDVADHAQRRAPLLDGFVGAPAIALSPDGRTLATGSGNALRLWDMAHVTPLGPTVFLDGFETIYAVAFSPDGKTLATADHNGRTYLWDVPGRGPAS